MNRRYFLSLVGAIIPLAGCSSPETETPNATSTVVTTPETTESTPTPETTETTETPGTPESGGTPDQAGDIFIVIQNQTSEQVTVTVTITSDGSVSFEDDTTLEPAELQHVYPEITDPGDYELSVAIPDRPEHTRQINIGEYALEEGSNIRVWISDEEVQVGIEE